MSVRLLAPGDPALADLEREADLPLPRLTRAEAKAADLVARRRLPLRLPSAVGPLRVSFSSEADAVWDGRWGRVDVAIGGRAAALFLPYEVIEGVIAGAFPDLDLDDIGAEERALLCESLESGLVEALSPGAWAPLTLAAVAPVEAPEAGPDAGPDALRFLVASAGGASIPAILRCHPVERERIRRAMAAAPPAREPFAGLCVPVAFRCGQTRIPLGELARLEPGCGILFDETTLGFQKIVAVTAERFAQTCTWQTIKPALDGPLLKPADLTARNYLARAALSDNVTDPAEESTASLDEVPIHLVFELGRTEIPIASLESLAAGYVFDLNKPLGQSVDIIANGRRVGAGELVRIGDGIGVRVTRLVR